MKKIATLMITILMLAALASACAPLSRTGTEMPEGAAGTPLQETGLPGGFLETPAAGEGTPAATEEAPVITEEAPVVTEEAPAAGEDTPAAATESGVIPPTGLTDPGRASNLMGISVLNLDGEEIGVVDDAILDINAGTFTYLVVSISVESEEAKLIPIPFQLLSWDAEKGAFVLSVDEQVVLEAPYFEGGMYPDTQEADWDAEFNSYWVQYLNPGG